VYLKTLSDVPSTTQKDVPSVTMSCGLVLLLPCFVDEAEAAGGALAAGEPAGEAPMSP
jgi:hypothetical protein